MNHPSSVTDTDLRSAPLAILGRYFVYLCALALLCQMQYWSVLANPGTRFSELSFVELAQSGLLLVSLILLWRTRQLGTWPAGTALMFGWLLASLIREQDFQLDRLFDGLWQWLVAVVAIATVRHLWRQREQIAEECRSFFAWSGFGLFMGGFMATYVFSRLMGRSALWEAVLGEAYQYRIKSGVEETLELLGYALMFAACVELWLLARRRFKRMGRH
ncbi:hypothetical protein C7446_1667 [Kushneria sinocarnis]|uniref:Uncharacterized protein n=1 Tax=Kushneria sinocarnis TaxID=595502 RepID=A0A420WXK3_9GAMM|nr:hypothetical protein [Kushneria sinocarnis]RKR04458.1 hypothetical protein C7446_1667 [Kushneria sinocarnis]